jgi:hypothetical protein
LRKAAFLALAGTLIAGMFGVVHDQITYTISPEYFTRMKFEQFHVWDFGFPRRLFVAEIGFLATWWVGLIGAWFLARVAVRKFSQPARTVMWALAFVMFVATASGISGFFWGNFYAGLNSGWNESLTAIGVTDHSSFNRVAGIHLGSYLGALVGWILAMLRFALVKRSIGVCRTIGC